MCKGSKENVILITVLLAMGNKTYILLFYTHVFLAAVSASKEEMRLVHDLLNSDYEKSVRPVMNYSSPVYVQMGLVLNQIIKLDERNQVIQNSIWLRFFWTDAHLTWNQSNYGGIYEVSLSSGQIWKPDISLYNNAGNKYFLGDDQHGNVLVNSTGDVQWLTPAMILSSCKIDVTYFPFDEQHCNMTFGSWIFNGDQIFLINVTEKGDTTHFVDNGEWELVDLPLYHHVKYYACCSSPFTDITYVLKIRRRPLSYVYNLLLPVMLITLIGIIGFYLPPDSGEKISLCITVLLAMTVFLLIIAENMPPTSEVVPLIGQYFGATIILLSLSTFMTVLVMNIHSRGSTGASVPAWLKSITRVLVKVFCMNLHLDEAQKAHQGDSKERLMYNNKDCERLHDIRIRSNEHVSHICSCSEEKQNTYTGQILIELERISNGFHERMNGEEQTEKRASEWRYVALVFDRLLLVTFLLVTVITSIAILCQPRSKP